jgi:CO/xanthine dehydrogenase Mo-binding subunit/aerobic-type carbon monoxide dehydrogenase small subunit (CoxS/CutS family)
MNAQRHDRVNVQLRVNGRAVEQEVPVATTLQQFLHAGLGLFDVKQGCGEGVCGACTVLLDGEAVAACLMLAAQASGRRVTTAAGLESAEDGPGAERVRALRSHLAAREAFQCGYCACGILVSACRFIASEGNTRSVREALSGNLCRCSGYQQMVEAMAAAAAGESPPEPKTLRDDLLQKLEGAARYPTDQQVSGALAGRVLWSGWPAANIRGIDTREAEALPGVEAVLTYRDVPGVNVSGTLIFGEDQPLLASDRVRSCGDAVALVAARTDDAAREAIRRIHVDYEPKPSVHDVLEALEPGAPQVGARSNVIAQFTHVKGDVERAFQQADAVLEGTYVCKSNDHACLERDGGTGWLDNGVLVLVTPTLTPHTVRSTVARGLGIREERIRIVTPRMGGSFGRYLVPSIESYLALLVFRTRKPVQLVLDREEALRRGTKRHAFRGRYRLGLKRDGTFLGLEADVIADAGPYPSLTPTVVAVFADEAAGAYEIPNLKVRARGVLTNNLLPAPMRGFGSQQINFGVESIVEKAARTLGLQPDEVRRKNYLRTRSDGYGGQVPDTRNPLGETMTRVVERLGPPPEPRAEWSVGRGVASTKAKYGYPYGMDDRFVARVSLSSAGRFTVESDVPDSGTGIVPGTVRLVARHLRLQQVPRYRISQEVIDDPSGFLLSRGRPPSRLRAGAFRRIENFQTSLAARSLAMTARMDPARLARLMRLTARPVNFFNRALNRVKALLFPFGLDSFIPRTSGTRGMLLAGGAALDAAERFRKAALEVAARALAAPVEEVELGPDGVHHVRDASRRIAWADVAREAGGELAALGQARLPPGNLIDPRSGNYVGSVDYMYASHGCDLAVNRETGEVRILRYVACHDVGKALDPETIRGQVLGGVVMGVGQALSEHLVTTQGSVQNAGLHDYLIPTSLDAPADVQVELVASGAGLGPEGARGIGESGAVAAPIAIANALYDALGVQLPTITATPEDIVNLVAMARGDRRSS